MARSILWRAAMVWNRAQGQTYLGIGSRSSSYRSFGNCTNAHFFSSLTPLLYFWILMHCIVLMVGAKYTYAEVPLFDWISEMFGQTFH